MDSEKELRLKLIIAFGGDVPKAEAALAFVNGDPAASDKFRCYDAWSMECYRDYCRRNGITFGCPASPEAQ